MLVLSRRPGEKIIINGDIEITVVSVKGERVRIGITAPPTVPVDREEIHRRRLGFEPRQAPAVDLAQEAA